MVIDYRKLNDLTIKDDYPLPDMRHKLDKLCGKSLFTKFDLCAGYNNIRIEPTDAYKATFKTPLGTYIPQVMGFGFSNAPPLFQRIMDCDLRPIKDKYPDNFPNILDDGLIATRSTPSERALHTAIIHELLDLFEQNHYFLKPSKCQFKVPEVEFLGFRIKDGELRVDPSKIASLRDWPQTLKNVKEI
jgi:hypothetical protein